MGKKPTKKELKAIFRDLGDRVVDAYSLVDDGKTAPCLFDKLQRANRFVRDATNYEKMSGDPAFTDACSYATRYLIPKLRQRLAQDGVIVRKDKNGDYFQVEDFWEDARILPRRQHNLNAQLADAISATGMSNRQIAEAAAVDMNFISGLLHGRASPTLMHGEWSDDTRRLCAFLGHSPEELFPKRTWFAAQRRAYGIYMQEVYAQNMEYGFTNLKVLSDERKDFIDRMFALLTREQRKALNYLFGLNGYPPTRPWQIAKLMGISFFRAQNLSATALRRLRDPKLNALIAELNDSLDPPLTEKASDILRPTGRRLPAQHA